MAAKPLQDVKVTARWHNIWLGCSAFFLVTTMLFAGLFGGYYSAWKSVENRPHVVYIVRHGEKVAGPLYSVGCLSKTGWARAFHLVTRFVTSDLRQPEYVYAFDYGVGGKCSDALNRQRTHQLAAPLAKFLGLSVALIGNPNGKCEGVTLTPGSYNAEVQYIKGRTQWDDTIARYVSGWIKPTTQEILQGLPDAFGIEAPGGTCTPYTLQESGMCCNRAAAQRVLRDLNAAGSGSTALVVWEHSNINFLTQALGVTDALPKWPDTDFDTIYAVEITATGAHLHKYAQNLPLDILVDLDLP